MKRILTLLAATALLASCGGMAVDPEMSKTVTDSEKVVIESAIPEGFKLADSRRIATDPPFVFAGYTDGAYKVVVKAFEMTGGKPAKTFETPVFEAENIFFNSDVEENAWGKTVAGNIILPVSIFMGGNDWSRAYTKFYTIRDGAIVELPVENEPGTVAGNMMEIDGQTVVPVFDARFQFFNGLPHAASPTREYIFKYDPDKKAFLDKTREELAFVEGLLEETSKMADENRDYYQSQQAAMVSIYIQSEAAGIADRYMKRVEELKNRYPNEPTVKKTWDQIQEAFADKKPFAEFAPWGDEVDFRWKMLEFKRTDGR